jgi:hypothetical protein
MKIRVFAPRFDIIGNGAIGTLAAWLLPLVFDEALEHIGCGVVVR